MAWCFTKKSLYHLGLSPVGISQSKRELTKDLQFQTKIISEMSYTTHAPYNFVAMRTAGTTYGLLVVVIRNWRRCVFVHIFRTR